MRIRLALLALTLTAAGAEAQTLRGRALGIPFRGTTGPNNAITDVTGVAVGHTTIIQGDGRLIPGKGPIRTGGTAILPRPRGNWDPVFTATFNLNGNGDMTGVKALVMLPNDRIDPIFAVTVDATEEAVVNAMPAAETMTGADGIREDGLPGDRLVSVLRKYNRME